MRSATGIPGWLTRGLAGIFFIGAELTAWNSRPCDRSTWLPGLRTFLAPGRPLSKSSLRCGCCTIFWSFGKLPDRIRHIPFAGPKYVVKKGNWSREDAKTLLESIPKDTVSGLRDLALIAAMFYSFARVSAVLKLKIDDYYHNGARRRLRLH